MTIATAPHPLNLGQLEYLSACLALANWDPSRDDGIDALKGYAWVFTNEDDPGHLFDKPIKKTSLNWWHATVGENSESIHQLKLSEVSKIVRSRLDQYLGAKGKPARALMASANAALEALTVRTKLHIEEDGTLVHLNRYKPSDIDGVVGLMLAFLLDPTLAIGPSLRRCELEECQRFFLAIVGVKGGAKRRYCCSDHQKKADKAKAVFRARQWRAG